MEFNGIRGFVALVYPHNAMLHASFLLNQSGIGLTGE